MSFLLDTNVVVEIVNGDPDIERQVRALGEDLFVSALSVVELDNGVYRDMRLVASRRLRLDIVLATVRLLPFDQNAVTAHKRIVAATGYSRRKVIDRMIGATAIAHDATLVTRNGTDFRDIPGLRLLEW